jgi:hypothetical protein
MAGQDYSRFFFGTQQKSTAGGPSLSAHRFRIGMTFSGHDGRVQEFRSLNVLLIGEIETLLQAAFNG